MERKISLVFFFSGFLASISSIFIYIIQETPFVVQLPTYLTLAICTVAPLKYKTDNYKPTILLMVYLLYAYLPYAYLLAGGLHSPASMFFVMGIFMFGVILKGKAKIIALSLLVTEYAALLFIGAYLPPFQYSSSFMEGLDFGFSFIVIAAIASMVTSIIVVAYDSEHSKIQRLLAELQEKNSELELLSTIDPLTGCYNRRYLYTHCESIVDAHKETRDSLSAFVIDIDHFKKINDTHGHIIGDDILKLTVSTIKSAIRLNDIVIRYGGEEFVILLPSCDKAVALQIAERIRASIENSRHRIHIQFTVSIGIALLGEKDNLHTLIERADTNLYLAKNNGRNQVVATQ